MTLRRQIQTTSVCALLALIAVALVLWLHQQPETTSIPPPPETGVQVGDLTDGTPADVTSEPAAVAETPPNIRSASASMVPPPVREAVDAPARVETLPRVEDYETMLVEVSALGENLSERQIADLYGFLKRPLKAFKGMDAPSVASLKNQAMDRLLEQKTLPADYAGKASAATLRALADDPAANTVLRLTAIDVDQAVSEDIGLVNQIRADG